MTGGAPLRGPIRIAADVGGTFTDLQVLDVATGRHFAFKTPTTPRDPSEGLRRGLEEAAAALGFAPATVDTLMHGTTIATNAVLEHKLPRGALVTTEGFRDVLEIGRHLRRDVYAAIAEPRRLLVARSDRHGVPERVAADGRVLEPLDETAARAVAGRIAASGAQTVAVCLLHAYANPAHERRLGEILAEVLGHGHVSLSHRVSPEPREFERTSTVALNALLLPVARGYLERLRGRLAEAGLTARAYLVQSNGGVTTPETAAEQPARLLLSGPSGGAIAAEAIGRALGEPNLVAADMGGTSFDVSVVHEGRVRLVTQGEVDGCPVRLPMIEIRTIGAGGGSIARVDEGGRLRVGPESAGADPGPVAYGRGGEAPTVTDANVVLGRIDPDYFLGGAMGLDPEAARRAVAGRIAAPLGLGVEEAAAGIVRIAVEHMASAIRLSLYAKGLDPKDFALLAFGGAGGLHAAEVAQALRMRRVVHPRDAGTLSAFGMLHCDVVHDAARSRLVPAAPDSLPLLDPLAAELLADGRARLDRDRVPETERAYALTLDLRYPGQAYEITVAVPGDARALAAEGIGPAALARAVAAFHEEHQARFAHAERHVTPEMVTMRLTATGRLESPAPSSVAEGPPAAPRAEREVFVDGAWRAVPIHRRDDLRPGAGVRGPAVIEDPYSTDYLPPGWRLACHPSGHLVAERES